MAMPKEKLDHIIKQLHIQPVGSGYIDLICPKENIKAFIDAMDALGVQILGFQWWCLVTDGHEPCGYGGPLNQYGEGWYSEVAPTEALLEFPDNQAVRDYLMHSYPNSSEYKPCHHPGFWLEMVT